MGTSFKNKKQSITCFFSVLWYLKSLSQYCSFTVLFSFCIQLIKFHQSATDINAQGLWLGSYLRFKFFMLCCLNKKVVFFQTKNHLILAHLFGVFGLSFLIDFGFSIVFLFLILSTDAYCGIPGAIDVNGQAPFDIKVCIGFYWDNILEWLFHPQIDHCILFASQTIFISVFC